jgi:hypothetical protein
VICRLICDILHELGLLCDKKVLLVLPHFVPFINFTIVLAIY